MSAEYIDKEKAIRMLSHPVTMSMCLDVDECNHKRSQREIDLELIKSIPSADVQPVRWIPVTEKLPEGKEGNYLVAAKTPRGIEVHEAVFFKPFDDYEWLDPVEEYQSYDVTHWMPLPQKPWGGSN